MPSRSRFPIVTGLAALVAAKHPAFGPEEIRQAIRKGSRDICAAGFIFVRAFVPETKGKSLEDIERQLVD